GTNCNSGGGKLISIDNGAAFPTYTNSKVRSRFEMSQRFSRSLIMELRALDKDTALEWLFPSPSRHEVEKFERFWKNRALVLERVDQLIEEHGEDAILALDSGGYERHPDSSVSSDLPWFRDGNQVSLVAAREPLHAMTPHNQQPNLHLPLLALCLLAGLGPLGCFSQNIAEGRFAEASNSGRVEEYEDGDHDL